MAKEEHLAVLKQGVEVWNKWREENPDVKPDLIETDLREITLTGADFSWVKLIRAKLDGMNLSNMKLYWANLSQSNLSGAKLIGADLSGVNFNLANLNGTDLSGTNLNFASFRDCNLCEAKLRGADITHSDLRVENLNEADLGDSIAGYTLFGDIDLSSVKGLETINHIGPSILGIDTIYKSKGKIPKVFLQGCGVPWNRAIEDLLVDTKNEYYRCFISYSNVDYDFANKLRDDLYSKNISSWFWPENAEMGIDNWDSIDRAINQNDKVILICSEASLNSNPVDREMERALQKEDTLRKRTGKKQDVLFPIRIDDYVFDKWEHPRRPDVLRKNVGDFTDWKNNDKYSRSLKKLVKALKKVE